MELLKAVERMNKLREDLNSLGELIGRLRFQEKIVTGREWIKLERAINSVIDEIAEEYREIESKVKAATENIKIDHKA